jgi:hypothetical protein
MVDRAQIYRFAPFDLGARFGNFPGLSLSRPMNTEAAASRDADLMDILMRYRR